MAAGIEEGGESYAKRCVSADLLHFCVSRLKLTPGRSEDEAFLDEVPSLMDLLRICTIPLFIPINAATKLSHPLFAAGKTEHHLQTAFANAEKALILLRGIIGTMWGMAAMLRAAERPRAVSSRLLTLLLRLLCATAPGVR